MSIRKNIHTDGRTSFYGTHLHTHTNLSPKTGINLPINGLCGPHATINSIVPSGVHIWHSEETHGKGKSSLF